MSGGGHAGGGGLGGTAAWPEGGGRRLGVREDWTGPRGSGRGGGGFGFDDGCVRTTEGMVLFWKEPACFVQWTPCSFELDGERYCNAEQWMMASKARLFNDRTALQQIMATADPRRQKALGRQVRGFDPAVWDKTGYEVVVRGNLAKFKQNPGFRDELLATGDRILAEASPYDSEWGIGLSANDADALIQARWPGRNKLGEALMDVRSQLRDEAYDEDQKEARGEEEEEEEGAEWVGDDARAAYATDEDWVMDDRPVRDDEDERVGRSRKYK
ncbi:unnamed protein product [Ectocarpus sp. 4 AP-2014]